MLDPFHDLKVTGGMGPELETGLNGVGGELDDALPAALGGGAEPADGGGWGGEPGADDSGGGVGVAGALNGCESFAAIGKRSGDAAHGTFLEFFEVAGSDVAE